MKKKDKNHIILRVLILFLIIMIFMASMYLYNKKSDKKDKGMIRMYVNDEPIAENDIERLYNSLPLTSKNVITRDAFLEVVISYRLLLQEARLKEITIADNDVESALVNIKKGMSQEDLNRLLKDSKMDDAILKEDLREQLMIESLLNKVITSRILVADAEAKNFYDSHKEEFVTRNKTLEFGEIKSNIKSALIEEKKKIALNTYLAQLKARAIISNETPISFKPYERNVCKIENKPVIRFYSTAKCKQCKWIDAAFINAIRDFVRDERIIAYHWQLDAGDNTLTEEIEETIPKNEKDIFLEYSPEGAIPLFVFGCGYFKLGIGSGEDLILKEKEFAAVINKILE